MRQPDAKAPRAAVTLGVARLFPSCFTGHSCFVPSGRVAPSSDVAWASCSFATVAPLRLASVQVGPAQVGPAQVGPAQVGPAQVGPAQVGPVQVGLVQVGLALPGWPRRSAPQVGPAGCHQVGPEVAPSGWPLRSASGWPRRPLQRPSGWPLPGRPFAVNHREANHAVSIPRQPVLPHPSHRCSVEQSSLPFWLRAFPDRQRISQAKHTLPLLQPSRTQN